MKSNLGIRWVSLIICLILGLGAGYGVAAFIVYQPQVTKLQMILTTTESELATVQSEKMVLEANYSTLSDRYSTLQTSYSGLSLDHSKLQSDYSVLNSRYSTLQTLYNLLSSSYSSLDEQYDTLGSRWDTIFQTVQSNYISSTFIYYTDYGESFNIMNMQIPYDTYKYYHEQQSHPSFPDYNLDGYKMYITPNEPIITSIVSKIKVQTGSEEELANALLDFVQSKSFTLSNRYYPTDEYKYPIEALVSMGGDCDTHAFLYATLLKAAGFKVLLAFTSDRSHLGVAVHLTNEPTHCEQNYYYFTQDGVRYYYAETTGWGWMVGELPPDIGESFYLVSV